MTCAFESLLHGKTYSAPTLAAVLVVLVGVGVCTVTDLSVSAFGLVTAAAGAVSTSLQQISVGELQQRYALGSFDLLIQTAPLQAVSLLLLGPAVDLLLTGHNVIHYTLTADATCWLFLLFFILNRKHSCGLPPHRPQRSPPHPDCRCHCLTMLSPFPIIPPSPPAHHTTRPGFSSPASSPSSLPSASTSEVVFEAPKDPCSPIPPCTPTTRPGFSSPASSLSSPPSASISA
ncbi:unnamed protein product [Closterium sp. NIES-54]